MCCLFFATWIYLPFLTLTPLHHTHTQRRSLLLSFPKRRSNLSIMKFLAVLLSAPLLVSCEQCWKIDVNNNQCAQTCGYSCYTDPTNHPGMWCCPSYSSSSNDGNLRGVVAPPPPQQQLEDELAAKLASDAGSSCGGNYATCSYNGDCCSGYCARPGGSGQGQCISAVEAISGSVGASSADPDDVWPNFDCHSLDYGDQNECQSHGCIYSCYGMYGCWCAPPA